MHGPKKSVASVGGKRGDLAAIPGQAFRKNTVFRAGTGREYQAPILRQREAALT